MKISACYIVKNTAESLEKSIRSIREQIDEIIVVDTGSTDRTMEVARSLGAAIYEYVWQADFAAARNFAIDKAKGQWIVFLDADEYVGDAHLLREIIDKATADVLLLTTVNIDEDRAGEVIDVFYAPRIFRNIPSIRYSGRIHEQLREANQPVRKMMLVPKTELILYHTGYSTSCLKDKAQRNLDILLKELKRIEAPEELYLALAESYAGIGDQDKALFYAQLEVARGRQAITYASRAYRLYLKLLEQKSNPDDVEIKDVLTKAICDFPELPEFRAEYAQYLVKTLDYEGAISQMEKALSSIEPMGSLEFSQFDAKARQIAQTLLTKWKQEKDLIENIKISACVIAKNEEHNIGRWIDNMKACSDEQIIVDTGSTDDTIAIAQAKGAVVFHYKWKDDFSAAKNFAIGKATGEWVLFLDADEFFPAKNLENVRKVIAREHLRIDTVDAIICTIINIDEDCVNREISRFAGLRIFRRDLCLRYDGMIHESLYHSERKLQTVIERKYLEIYHTGYSSQRIRGKLKRNLLMLQADIARNGENIRHYRYLMDCFQGLGNHEKTIEYGQKLLNIEAGKCSLPDIEDVYRTMINSMTLLKRPSVEIVGYIEKALELYPKLPDFYAYYGAWYFYQKNFNMAKKYLLQALSIYENMSNENVESSSFAYILSETYSYLGEIFSREKELSLARKYLELALLENKYNGHAFREMYHLAEERSISAVEKILKKYYSEEGQTILFVVVNLEEVAIDDVYFHYAEKLERKYHLVSQRTKWHRLFVMGQTDEVYQQSLRMMVQGMQQLSCALLCLDKDENISLSKEFLPLGLWRCIQRYYGDMPLLEAKDIDAYLALLPVVLDLEQKTVVCRFLELSKDFSAQYIRDILLILFEKKCWAEIEMLEPLVFEDVKLFRILGIAAYYNKEFDKSRLYLDKARACGVENDVESYLTWINEREELK